MHYPLWLVTGMPTVQYYGMEVAAHMNGWIDGETDRRRVHQS